MIDIHARDRAPASGPPPPTLHFFSIQVMPMGSGEFSVSLTGTYLDEEVLDFVNEDIECLRFASIDEASAAIRSALARAFAGNHEEGH